MNHSSVVMLSRQMGNFRCPAKCGAYALVLVQRHVDAVPASADGDSWMAFPVFHGISQRMCVVRVVHTLHGVGAEIFVCPSFLVQPAFDECHQCEASVVACQSYRIHANIVLTSL